MTTWSDTELLARDEWVASLWRGTLGRGANPVADFYTLGGDDSSAQSFLNQVNDYFGSSVTLDVFRRDPSLHALLIHLGAVQLSETCVPLRQSGTRPPLFLIAGAGGVALQFTALTRALGDDQPVTIFQSPSMTCRHAPEYSLAAAGRRIARAIQRRYPAGPLVLGGHSLGGLVSLHAAHALKQRGREVNLIATLDCFPGPHMLPPGARRTSQAAQTHVKRPTMSLIAQMALAGWWRYPTPIQCQLHFRIGVARWLWARPVKPWRGPVCVVASEWESDYVAQTWPQLAPDNLTIVGVPGNHTSMLSVDHVGDTARAISESIARLWDEPTA